MYVQMRVCTCTYNPVQVRVSMGVHMGIYVRPAFSMLDGFLNKCLAYDLPAKFLTRDMRDIFIFRIAVHMYSKWFLNSHIHVPTLYTQYTYVTKIAKNVHKKTMLF